MSNDNTEEFTEIPLGNKNIPVRSDKVAIKAMRDQCFDYKELLNSLTALADFNGLTLDSLREGIKDLSETHSRKFKENSANYISSTKQEPEK